MSASHMIDSVKYNLGQLKDRREVFDTSKFQKKVYGAFKDKVCMKSHEFAAFQKRLFEEKKREKKRTRRVLIFTIIATLLLIVLFLIGWHTIDFHLLEPKAPYAFLHLEESSKTFSRMLAS